MYNINQLSKYKKIALDSEEIASIEDKLQELIVYKKYFRYKDATLKTTATQLNLSSGKFSAYLNGILNKSYSDFVNEIRINDALDLLNCNEKIKIKSIVAETGFKSTSSFYSAFKKHTGLTPAEINKKYSQLV